jgi:hypothetical protein
MREKINSSQNFSELITITVKNSREDLKQIIINDEGEFVYQGALYDVVKKVVTTDFTTYYCLNDAREEQLLRNFCASDPVSQKSHPVSQSSTRILQNLIAHALVKDKYSIRRQTVLTIFKDHNIFWYASIDQTVPTRPPVQA